MAPPSARLVGGARRRQHQLARDRDALLDVLLADVAQRRVGERRRDRLAGDRHELGRLLGRQAHADKAQHPHDELARDELPMSRPPPAEIAL